MRRTAVALLLLLGACTHRAPPRPSAPVPVADVSLASMPPLPPLGGRPAHVGPLDPAVTESDLDALWNHQLMVPVEGLNRAGLRDDFTAKRGTDRMHGALDLLAPRYAAVLAADDCVIGRMFSGPVGGIVIYATALDGQFVYYYAHLHRYAKGLAVGDRVAKGTVIGYVGTTGNAPPDTPHLHFQIMKRGAGRVWWDGPPINPFHFFALDGYRQ